MAIEIKEIEKEATKKIVGTQVNQELFLKLKEESDENFMSISDLLRKIIFTYYRDKERKEK